MHGPPARSTHPTLDFVESTITPRLNAGRGPPWEDRFLYTRVCISSASNFRMVRDTEYKRPSCNGGAWLA